MSDGRRSRLVLLVSQLLLGLIVILLVYLVIDFGHQVVDSYQRQEELRGIERAIELAQDQTLQLEARLDYAQSTQAAEAWAREQGWARADEVPVLILAPPDTTTPPSGGSTPAETGEITNPEAWWDFFFGQR